MKMSTLQHLSNESLVEIIKSNKYGDRVSRDADKILRQRGYYG